MDERQLSADIFQVMTGSSEPIYRQLVEQLRRLVASNQVKANDSMPSVREVAASLGVNPMTVSKAYSLLETEGILLRRRGLGMVVAERNTQASLERLELLRPSMERLAVEAKQLELERESVIALFSQILDNN
jgi:GntR family transcriptional regulator